MFTRCPLYPYHPATRERSADNLCTLCVRSGLSGELRDAAARQSMYDLPDRERSIPQVSTQERRAS